jgi:hypothetical protein
MLQRPPDFPFFELREPARSCVPDFCRLQYGVVSAAAAMQPAVALSAFYPHPTLDEILAYWRGPNGCPGLTGPIFAPLAHGSNSGAYGAVNQRRNLPPNPAGPLPAHSAGSTFEANAYHAVKNFFVTGRGARPMSASYNKAPVPRFQNNGLIFEALYVQVCVIGEKVPGQRSILYVIDQLWQIRVGKLRYFIAVELDGADKWLPENKAKANARSFGILDEDIMLCRLSSALFRTSDDPRAISSLETVWKGLHMGYWLHSTISIGAGQYTVEEAKELLALEAVQAGTSVDGTLLVVA